ncbi:MAG: MFS transporter [Armatimonadota bacterium]
MTEPSSPMHADVEEQNQPLPVYQSGPLRGLTPNVIRLGLVSFFADVSSEMLYPITPIFLTLVLGAPMAVVGLIEGVAEATANVLKTASGWMSDHTGRRRPFVIFGYTLSALSKPLLALAQGWGLVLGARVLDRFGKGVRSSPRDALLADSVPEASRGKAFGWHRGMDTLGAVIGPLIALPIVLLADSDPERLRAVFLWAFIPGIIGAVLVLLVRDRQQPRAPHSPTPSLRWRNLPGPYRGYLLAWGSFALANSSDVFLILRAQQLGYSTALVIGLYAFYNLVYALASPSLGHLSDRCGRWRVLIGGLVVFALVYAGFAFVPHPVYLWPLFAIYGLYTAATDGVGKALAVDLVPKSIRAGALGLLSTVAGFAALVASTAAGLLWTHFGPPATFLYGALGAVVGIIWLARLQRVCKVN